MCRCLQCAPQGQAILPGICMWREVQRMTLEPDPGLLPTSTPGCYGSSVSIHNPQATSTPGSAHTSIHLRASAITTAKPHLSGLLLQHAESQGRLCTLKVHKACLPWGPQSPDKDQTSWGGSSYLRLVGVHAPESGLPRCRCPRRSTQSLVFGPVQ